MTNVPPPQPAAPPAEAPLPQVKPAAVVSKPLWDNVTSARYQPARTAWLVSFIDLTGLMVAFFVLLFSMQTMEREKWEAIAGSFKSTFAPRETVVAQMVGDVNNAELRSHGAPAGLGYLDVLLQQHLASSKGWSALRGEERLGVHGREMVYPLAADKHDPELAKAAWETLGAALRGWKNPVGVRVSTPQPGLGKAAQKAQRLAMILNATGVDSAFAEVVEGPDAVELVVRAR